MDLSLDCGRSSVECETHQYNLHTIVETEVMGMYVKSVFVVHVGGTRCVTSSTDQIMNIHARITLTVECTRT